MNDLFGAMQSKYPQVRAFCWFNWRSNESDPPWDWPIESSAAAETAFDQDIASSYFVGR